MLFHFRKLMKRCARQEIIGRAVEMETKDRLIRKKCGELAITCIVEVAGGHSAVNPAFMVSCKNGLVRLLSECRYYPEARLHIKFAGQSINGIVDSFAKQKV